MKGVSADVSDRVDFGQVRYANCWEDSSLLLDALRPAPGMRILSIASAGDNSLHMLACGAEVIAADLSQPQLACVELRIKAIRHMNDAAAMAFLGFSPANNRVEIYSQLRNELSANTRAFWDANRPGIENGIIHYGRFERFFSIFRKRVLPLIHARKTVAALLTERSRNERIEFYDKKWNNRRWRFLFQLFFSRTMMGRLGRDPEFFRYVEGSVSERILNRTKQALTLLETHSNPYLEYILTGSFTQARPDWTRPDVLNGIRENAAKLTLYQGGIEDAARHFADGGFDGYNLSDIFEYLDPAASAALYGSLLNTANNKARLAYWNMLVPRTCPPEHTNSITPLKETAAQLFARDRAFFYSAFHVDEVNK